MGSPTVSVLMNCLNGARWLREALDSVVAQIFTDWEVIFWDECSNDQSAEIATSYRNRLRYFLGSGGQPLGASRNLALAKARGRYLAMLDCDDLWYPSKLARQVAVMDAAPALAFTFSDCDFIDAAGMTIGTAFARTPPPPDGWMYRGLLTSPNYMLCPTLLFRTAAVQAVGGFNPTLAMAETYDLCVRISQYLPVAWSRRRLAAHRRHPGQANGAGKAQTYREVLQVMKEHRKGASWPQIKREALLWGKYLVKTIAHS